MLPEAKIAIDNVERENHRHQAVLAAIARGLAPPTMQTGPEYKGFRYTQPTALHFCLLMLVKGVSAVNACILLARGGFIQEACVIMRTVVEAYTKVNYILSGIKDGVLAPKQSSFLEKFFNDFERGTTVRTGAPNVRQKDIHDEIGRFLHESLEAADAQMAEQGIPASSMMSNIYRVFSNYVHGGYPEIIDLWGGAPGRFHMQGMSETPKDLELAEMLPAICESLGLSLRLTLAVFALKPQINA